MTAIFGFYKYRTHMRTLSASGTQPHDRAGAGVDAARLNMWYKYEVQVVN